MSNTTDDDQAKHSGYFHFKQAVGLARSLAEFTHDLIHLLAHLLPRCLLTCLLKPSYLISITCLLTLNNPSVDALAHLLSAFVRVCSLLKVVW